MPMVSIDIPSERVGAFRIGARIPLPGAALAKLGITFCDGDFVDLEGYQKITITLRATVNETEFLATVIAIDCKSPDVLIAGEQLSEWTLSRLLKKLEPNGIRLGHMDDDLRFLSDGTLLYCFGDAIESMCLGFAPSEGTSQSWKDIEDPRAIKLIVDAADESLVR